MVSVRTPAVWLVLALLAPACGQQTHTIGQLSEDQIRDLQERTGNSGAGSGPAVVTGQPLGGSETGGSGSSEPPEPMTTGTAADCEWDVRGATRRPLDMYLLMDSNITVPLFGAWNVAVVGLGEYVDDPRSWGTGVGLRYFGFECTPETYAEPNVPVRPLPDNATAIKSYVQLPITVSSMLPVLQGGIQHARSRANTFVDRKQVVVLITDGFADLACFSGQDTVVQAALDGLLGSPPIPTYVIGLGDASLPNPLDMLARLAPLDFVAAAGGTDRAYQVATLSSPTAMTETLVEVQRAAEPCEYTPIEPFGDPTETALGVALPGAVPQPLPRVVSPSGCGDREGFFYDDLTNPTSMVACAASCERIKSGEVQVTTLTGCTAPTRGSL